MEGKEESNIEHIEVSSEETTSGSSDESQRNPELAEKAQTSDRPVDSDFCVQKVAILKEKAHAYGSLSKFYEASAVLEEIEENEGMDNLGMQLLAAEIDQQLGRENRANKCIKYIREALTSQPTLDVDDLIAFGTDLIAKSSNTRAMLILKIGSEVALNGMKSPDEVLSAVYRCYSKIDDVVTAMINQKGRNRTIAADFGIEIMLEIYKNICDIRGCSRGEQVLKEAWCCRYLDYNYALLQEHKKSIAFAERAVKNMENHFTPDGAQRHRIYGITLHNLAVTLGNTNRLKDSVDVYQKAIEAKENALDYENEQAKINDIDTTKKSQRKVKILVGKA